MSGRAVFSCVLGAAVLVVCFSFALEAVEAWHRRDYVDAVLACFCLILLLLIAGVTALAIWGSE